jgi:16S rRNA (cytosine1402-N4)-methyltransferase
METPALSHTPVLLAEVTTALQPRAGGRYLDATVGLGGHAYALLDGSAPDGTLWGVDWDGEALALAQARLAPFGDRVRLAQGRYEALPAVVGDAAPFDGVLFDLGASSYQFDAADRGFSFGREGPLDMRMNRREGRSAAELVAEISERELADLIYRWGEDRWSRRIARAIVQARLAEPITTTTRLAETVARAIPRRFWPHHIHPATRTFQALRVAVNEELVGLEPALEAAVGLLGAGGRAAVISFHSLEDRIVKHTWRRLADTQGLTLVTKRPITPGADESAANPRARSAKLRVIERPRAA